METAQGFLTAQEAAAPAKIRVNGTWRAFLCPAARLGSAMLAEAGDLYPGLGFSAAELFADPDRLSELTAARAAAQAQLQRIDRAILFYKARIAGRTRTLLRAVTAKRADPSLDAATSDRLRDVSLNFRALFAEHHGQQEARRQATLKQKDQVQKIAAERDHLAEELERKKG
jgi:hypothetical protein